VGAILTDFSLRVNRIGIRARPDILGPDVMERAPERRVERQPSMASAPGSMGKVYNKYINGR
jgi:hypothetical protein